MVYNSITKIENNHLSNVPIQNWGHEFKICMMQSN